MSFYYHFRRRRRRHSERARAVLVVTTLGRSLFFRLLRRTAVMPDRAIWGNRSFVDWKKGLNDHTRGFSGFILSHWSVNRPPYTRSGRVVLLLYLYKEEKHKNDILYSSRNFDCYQLMISRDLHPATMSVATFHDAKSNP